MRNLPEKDPFSPLPVPEQGPAEDRERALEINERRAAFRQDLEALGAGHPQWSAALDRIFNIFRAHLASLQDPSLYQDAGPDPARWLDEVMAAGCWGGADLIRLLTAWNCALTHAYPSWQSPLKRVPWLRAEPPYSPEIHAPRLWGDLRRAVAEDDAKALEDIFYLTRVLHELPVTLREEAVWREELAQMRAYVAASRRGGARGSAADEDAGSQ